MTGGVKVTTWWQQQHVPVTTGCIFRQVFYSPVYNNSGIHQFPGLGRESNYSVYQSPVLTFNRCEVENGCLILEISTASHTPVNIIF